jgi:hypothetical protein
MDTRTAFILKGDPNKFAVMIYQVAERARFGAGDTGRIVTGSYAPARGECG